MLFWTVNHQAAPRSAALQLIIQLPLNRGRDLHSGDKVVSQNDLQWEPLTSFSHTKVLVAIT